MNHEIMTWAEIELDAQLTELPKCPQSVFSCFLEIDTQVCIHKMTWGWKICFKIIWKRGRKESGMWVNCIGQDMDMWNSYADLCVCLGVFIITIILQLHYKLYFMFWHFLFFHNWFLCFDLYLVILLTFCLLIACL